MNIIKATKFNNLMKKLFLFIAISIFPVISYSAGDSAHPIQQEWPFSGASGKFDKQAIQRGYQVYKEVCASCHSMKRISFRNLLDIGFSEAEAKTIASEYTVTDGPDDSGDMFERPAILSDYFVKPYANENAARASNGGAFPPDLSLIVKARPDGANYVYSLLNGYKEEPPHGVEVASGMSYNTYFPENQIAMANPLSDGQVEYIDSTKATVSQMSYDVVNFLQWAAEPEMEDRKKMGIKILIFLLISTLFFYIAKKRIWKNVR